MSDDTELTTSAIATSAGNTEIGNTDTAFSGGLVSEAEHAAVDIAEAAVPAAVEAAAAHVSGGMLVAGEAAAVAAGEAALPVAEKDLPPIEHTAWNDLKDWIRRELDLVGQGFGPQERATHNP